MGMSGSSQKTTSKSSVKPIYAGEIKNSANILQDAYTRQAPKIGVVSDQFLTNSSKLLGNAIRGNPAVNAAEDYVVDTITGDGSNPYIDEMADITGNRIRNQMQASMGTRGLTGTSNYADMITRALAENETNLRYQDYDREQARRAQAAGMAPSVAAGEFLGYAPALATAQFGANAPLDAGLKQAAGIGGLLGQYTNQQGTQVTKQDGGLMPIIGAGLQAASLFSDERLKSDVKRVGKTDKGLPIYTYRMGDGPVQMGVLAQEVEKRQPGASGPTVGGYRSVDYGRVR